MNIGDLELDKHYLIRCDWPSNYIEEVCVKSVSKDCVLLRTYTPNNNLIFPYHDQWLKKDENVRELLEELTGEGLRIVKKMRDEEEL